MVFVAVVGPCLVARGPSAAFPEEVGAAGAFLEEVRLVAAAEEEAFPVDVLPSAAEEEAAAPLPCRVAGRTSRPGSFAYARGREARSRARPAPSRFYSLRRRLRADAAAARERRWRLLARRAAHGVA